MLGKLLLREILFCPERAERGVKNDDLIKISEMAKMCGISRQTLILYDKNGLLKPAYVSETGYRYYSVDQLPYLRLICLLKSLGVTLAELNVFLHEASPDDRPERAAELLDSRAAEIREQVARLRRQAAEVDQLGELLRHAPTRARNANVPYVEWIEERKAIFVPFPAEEMDAKKLHITLMKAWRELLGADMIPSRGFGSLIRTEALNTEAPLAGAGSIVLLPHDHEVPGATVITLPAGEYVTMYNFSMPYDLEPDRELLAWVREQGLEPQGNIVDCCLLDTVFHTEQHPADFCRVEIRVR